MSETESAIDGLVDLVHETQSDGESIRDAFASAFAQLDVVVGDPAWTDGLDIAGEAYQRVLSNSQRRAKGQFFTPLSVGKLLAEWALGDSPREIFDPACGSGSLLIAASKLLGNDSTVRLIGQDVDPVVLQLADFNKRVRRIGAMEFHVGDFLTESPAARSGGVVCNPPYTRHQDIDADTKARIHEGFEDRLGIRFSRMASLHSLFLVRAIETSADGASIAFITPSHWLDMNYGSEVKAYLLQQATIDAFIEFPATEKVFGRVDTTATITLLHKSPPPADHVTRFYGIPSLKVGDSLASLMTERNETGSKKLASSENWHRARPSTQGKRLGDLARVSRGLATGSNSYFVLSEEGRREHQLPDDWFVRCAPAPRFFGGSRLDQEGFNNLPDDVSKWLLVVPEDGLKNPSFETYEALGRKRGVDDAYLVRARSKRNKPWFRIDPPAPSPILFSYFNRERARFVRNTTGAISLNNWLSISPADGVDADALFIALQDSRTLDAIRRGSRVYSNGLWKVEPGEMLDIKLPAAVAEMLA